MQGPALIFDCDGVLVDSEPLSVAELGRTLREAGAAITDAQIYDRMIGMSVASILAMMREEQGVDAAPLLDAYRARLRARFEADLTPVPGIAAAIGAMGGLPRIVASSSSPDRIAQSLRLTGLAEFFGGNICSAVEVVNGKPAPDLFLLAAERLGVSPARCIVIEDSAAGVRAAKAAGMRVVGFLGGAHAAAARLSEKLPMLDPDAVASQAGELPAIVAGLIARDKGLTGEGRHVSGD